VARATKEQIAELRVRLRTLRVFMANLKDKRLQDAEVLLSVVEAEIDRNCNFGRRATRH
jgi:hypothetical protein